MSEPQSSDLDSDLRLRLSQAMLDQSLRPVVDADQPTLITSEEEGPGGTLVMDEREQQQVQERDAATAGAGLPKHMSGPQEWVLLPLSDAPEGVIGVGGEGVVYSYVQRELGREVAVKTLRADRWSHDAIESLLREACVTARLEHPNIVPVHYLHLPEHDGDSPYWVMKRVRGKPLAEHLPGSRDPWSFDKLLDVFRRILDAVAYAHSKGIVHRDLKPDNVLVGQFGEVQVTDWGLAVATSEDGACGAAPLLQSSSAASGDGPRQPQTDSAGGEQDSALSEELVTLNESVRSGRVGALLNTDAGGRAGTPVYMTPEQLDLVAGSVDERTDTFLLGGVLYALLTGQPPRQFVAGGDTGAAKRRIEQIRSCSDVRPVVDVRREHGLSDVPEVLSEAAFVALWDITKKALSPEPGDRFESVAALEVALDEWESRSASQELSVRASARLDEVASRRRPSACGYAEVIALADASLGEWRANDRARRIREQASSALGTIQRRSSRRLWTAVAAIVLVFVAGGIGYQKTLFQWNRAEEQKEEAERERRRANTERDKALREMYYASVALADQRVRGADIDEAERLLDACPVQFRSWEWGRLRRLCHLELTALKGHELSVTSVAFSPDGQRLASGSHDRTIRLWNMATGLEVMTLTGHSESVRSVAFSADGRRIASGSWDRTVRFWDARTGSELLILKGHRSDVRSVAFSPSGDRVASGSWDRTVKVWDTGTGRELLTLAGHQSYVWSVAFDPTGTRIASGAHDGDVKVWDAASGREIATLGRRGCHVYSVAFSPDGEHIASATSDKTVELWRAEDGRQMCAFRGHRRPVLSVAFAPGGKRIASGSPDGTVKLWDVASRRSILTLKGAGRCPYSVAFSPDGRRIATGSFDRSVKIWDAQDVRDPLTLTGHRKTVSSVSFSFDNRRIASGSWDGTVRIWDPETGREVRTLEGHGGQVRSLAFSHDGTRIVSGGEDRMVRIWDPETGREVMLMEGHTDGSLSVAFGPHGRRVVSGGRDKTVKVWDMQNGRAIRVLGGHSAGVTSVAFSPNGRQVASGSADRTVKLWNAETGREFLTLEGHSGSVYSVAFRPGGEEVASGSLDSTVRIWHAGTGREVRRLEGHGGPVHSVAFSPDGKRVVTGSYDNTVRVWDGQTGREMLALSGHGEYVACIAWGHAGKRIASGSADKTVRIWEAGTLLDAAEMCAAASRGEPEAIFSLALAKERRHSDLEARELHLRVAAVTELAQREWAEKSRWRLNHMPWLQLNGDR